jgi:hypothetical protein
MPAGNNKSIRDWPINSSVGYAIHKWHMPVRNTLKTMPFTNGMGRIREWDLFVVGPEHIILGSVEIN